MIYDYEIKKEKNKEVLYLYCDFQQEIGSLFFNKEEESFFDYIKNYIRKNRIKFSGNLILVVVSGLVISKIYLNPDTNFQETITIPAEIEITENINKENNIEEEQIKEQEKEDTTIQAKETKKEPSPIKENTKEEASSAIYLSLTKNGITNKIELEEYVEGVVAAEMPASFQEEALKAQSVLARTYALKAIQEGKTLQATNSNQNYKTKEELQNLWGTNYTTYYNKIKKCTESTKNEYLSYQGNYIEAVYHSTSNGQTESSINVWNNYYPYLISVESPYDYENPTYQKEVFYTYEELTNKLNTPISQETEWNIISKTEGNRIKEIEINSIPYSGVEIRNILNLRSTDFELEKQENGILIKTNGYGHGVGLSQYGANGMAKKGYTYQEILSHYYPGTTIRSIEN